MLSLRHLSTVGVLLLAAGSAQAQQALPPDAPVAPAAPPPGAYPEPAPLEPFPAPAPLAPGAPSAAEAPAAAPEPPPLPDRVGIGKFGGYVQVGATIQAWGVATHVDNKAGTDTTFRIRRAEVKLKGEFVPKFVKYNFMFDVAKTFSTANAATNVTGTDGTTIGTVPIPQASADRSPLQDIWITYMSDFADVSIGQFKIPVGLEANQSTAALLFPERNRVDREFGDRRDIGVRVEKKIADVFYYQASIFNGQGQNILDADRRKDAGLRLEAYPIKALTVGAVAYGTIGGRDLNVRDRLEADLRLEIANLIVQGSYIHGWTGPENRRLEGQGVYGQVGYTILDTLQPAFRLGLLDINMGDDIAPRTEAESGPLRFFQGSVNYLVRGYDLKLTLDVSHYAQEHGADTTEGTFAAQLNF